MGFVVTEGPKWPSIPFSEKRNRLKGLEEGVIYRKFSFLALILPRIEMGVKGKVFLFHHQLRQESAPIFLNALIMDVSRMPSFLSEIEMEVKGKIGPLILFY